MRKTKVAVSAEQQPNGYFHVKVEEFPGILGVCRSRQNIARTARDTISTTQGIPASRIEVMKVQVS